MSAPVAQIQTWVSNDLVITLGHGIAEETEAGKNRH